MGKQASSQIGDKVN